MIGNKINDFLNPYVLLYMGIFCLLLVSCSEQKQADKKEIKTDPKAISDTSFQTINEQIKKTPLNADLYVLRAKQHIKKRDYSEARDDVNRAINIDSNIASYFYLRADLLFMAHQTREARADLEKAIELNPSYIEAHLKLAEIYMLLDEFKISIEWIDKALRIDVFNPRAYFQKGMTFKYGGDTLRAISSFQTAVEQNPDYYKAYIQLGILFEKRNPTFALDYYNNAIQIQPSSLEAIYHKSYYLHYFLGNYKKAKQGYSLMVNIEENNYQGNFNLGLLYLENFNKPDSAIYHFKKLENLFPKDYKILHNLGLAFQDSGNNEQAKIHYKKALAIKPDFTLSAKQLNTL